MSTDTPPKLPTEPLTVIRARWDKAEKAETYIRVEDPWHQLEPWLCLEDRLYWDLDSEDVQWHLVSTPNAPKEPARGSQN